MNGATTPAEMTQDEERQKRLKEAKERLARSRAYRATMQSFDCMFVRSAGMAIGRLDDLGQIQMRMVFHVFRYHHPCSLSFLSLVYHFSFLSFFLSFPLVKASTPASTPPHSRSPSTGGFASPALGLAAVTAPSSVRREPQQRPVHP